MTTLHCFEVAEHPYSKGNLNRRPVTGLTSRSSWQHGRAQAATASRQAPNEFEGHCKTRACAARAAGRKMSRSTQKSTYLRQKMENSTEAQAACESSRRLNSESSSNTITWTDHIMQAACKEPIRKVRKGRSEPCRKRTLDAGDDRRVRKLPQHVAMYRYIGHHAWVPAVAKALVRVG